MAHFAILVAISSYPGLQNLDGPENDVEDFRQWLVAPDGGNLRSENVTVIKSSDYPAQTDPSLASPTEREFKKALTTLLFDGNGNPKEQVGERLYLFFAGHGFAGRRLAEAALYTAQATHSDCAHIPCKRYAERIANSAAFDEIVLAMDCCRDVDLSDSIQDPTLKLRDRQHLAAHVRLFQAYAAGRGQQARERVFVAGGPVRGIFTYAFVDALRHAKGDAEGNVTGTLLKGYILDRWPALFAAQVTHEPDIYPPGGSDIVFVRRVAPVPEVEVRFRLAPPLPQPGTMIVIENPPGTVVSSVAFDPAGTCAFLPSSFYKASLTGTTRSTYIDAAGASVEVSI